MNVENTPAGRSQVEGRPTFTGQDSHLARRECLPNQWKTRSQSEKTV